MIGMCQKCYSSGVEVRLAEITKNEVGSTEVVMCEICSRKDATESSL